MPSSLTTVGSVLRGIVSGKSVQTLERPAQDNELGILKVSAVTWGAFRPNENKALPPSYDPKDCPRPMDGDILISRANTRELVGAPVMVHGDYPHLLLSDKLLKLIPDETAVDARYLVRALRSPSASAHFFQCAGGSSGSMTNITQSDIRSAPIYLPPLEEQRRIAAILDQAETLRTQRRTALALLDSLTQSLFLDMFGDDDKGEPRFAVAALADVMEMPLQNGAYYPKEEYVSEGGVEMVHMSDAFNGIVDRGSLKRVNCSDADLSKYGLNESDILLARRSLTYEGAAKPCLVPPAAEPLIFESSFIRVTPDRKKLSVPYLFHYLDNPTIRDKRVRPFVTQSTISGINQSNLERVAVVVPPLPLQQTFATRIASIEALKTTHRRALNALDALFASLQQRAFAGQL